MAIYGIGAYHDGNDVSENFIRDNVVCIGWGEKDAPTLYTILRQIKIGDIVYIKSAPIGQSIRIKAVGIITNNVIEEYENLGSGLPVRWMWSGAENLNIDVDKYNVRNNTIYEEFNKDAQIQIVNLLLLEE